MSLFEFCSPENMQLFFFTHLKTCEKCGKVNQEGLMQFCLVGGDLYEDFKRAMRETADASR